MDNINTNNQTIVNVLKDEVYFFERFTRKHGIKWGTIEKNNHILPLSKAYVGYIVTPIRKIELVPKYSEISFEHIFRMYLYVHGYKSSDNSGVLDVAKVSNDIDIAKLFFDDLQKNIQRGIIQTYQKKQIETKEFKGNVNFNKTYLNYLKGKKKPINTKVSKLSLDNPENRLIVTALTKLRHVKKYSSLSNNFLMYFENVFDKVDNGSELFESINFNSNTLRYRQTLLYAAMIIDDFDYDDVGNSVGTESFILNFDRLFEDFVVQILKKIPKKREFITWNDSKKYADVIRNGTSFDKREYLPDILFRFKLEDEKIDYLPSAYAVLDVKNKAYGIFKNADVYQILTYARILNSAKAVLIYPSFSNKYADELILNSEIFYPAIVVYSCYINIAENSGTKFLDAIDFFVETVEKAILDK